MKRPLFIAGLLLVHTCLQAIRLTDTVIHHENNSIDLSLRLDLDQQELVYSNTIVLSVNHPDVQLEPWHTDAQVKFPYVPKRKDNTAAYTESFTIHTTAHKKTDVPLCDAQIHLSCATNKTAEPIEHWTPISFSQDSSGENQTQQQTARSTASHKGSQQKQTTGKEQSQTLKEWVKSIQSSLTQTHSWLLKLLFAFLLGILLSLTPCIYPMVPITVGVLQSQGSKSLLRNFCLSSAYTLGISTTFSLFGLLAATSGEAFGHILGNPIFILCIVALLSYFALSLFGLYNLYIPRFLQQKRSISGGGSFLSIFAFGLVSGSVASPCLSPGLALILSMVAAMANKFFGFLLLFAFGVGISMPLLIIGTFSGSINLLPRAGSWMLEVQKLFGFMLFGMCFYYLNNILPWWIIAIMLTIFALCSGLYYLRSASETHSPVWRAIKNVLGVAGVVLSVFLLVESFQEIYYPKLDDGIESTWYTDYQQAILDAKKQDKKLFLDFWAPYCSLCKLITSTVLKDPAVAKVLSEKYIVVSINGNDADLEPFKSLKDRYGIQGFPNLLIVDPRTGQELHRWRGEIEDESIADVIAELHQYAE